MRFINFKLLVIAIFATGLSVKAQSTIDYETVGQNWGWTVFANGAAQDPSNFSITSNPASGGINTSANVAKLFVNSDASRWAGVITTSIPRFTLSTGNSKIKVMVYKSVISPFQLEFKSDGSETASTDDALQVSNTVVNQWEELTFDFSAFIGHTYACLVVIPDFPATARTAGSTNYWDNISFNNNNVTAVSNTQDEIIHLFPNPVKDVLNFSSKNIEKVIITNTLGQVIKSINIKSSDTYIDLKNLNSGNYFVTLFLHEGKVSNQKIVKL